MSPTPPEPDRTGPTPSPGASQPQASRQEAKAARRTAAEDDPFEETWEPPPNAVDAKARSGDTSLLYFWNIFKNSKLIIFIITLFFSLWGVYNAYTAPLVYQSTVTLMPAQQSQGSLRSMLTSLGQSVNLIPRGLMSISAAHKVTKSLEIVRSHEFIAEFIREENLRRRMRGPTRQGGFQLISDLLRKYDEFTTGIFSIPERALNPERYEKMQASIQSGGPNLSGPVRRFRSRHMRIDQDPLTQVIRLSVFWHDPETAAEVANKLAAKLNSKARTEAISGSRLRIKHLEAELLKTSLVETRQSIYGVIQMEINQITLAETETDYVFEVIDPAIPPHIARFVQPSRSVIMVGATVFGLGFSFSLAAALAYVRGRRDKAKAKAS